MADPDAIRDAVSEAYARALRRAEQKAEVPSSTLIRATDPLAEYSEQEIAELPGDLGGTAFGCGNPLAFSEVKEGQVVVDLGSGAGMDLLLAARKVGPEGRVIGVDMTEAMVQRARENIARSGCANAEVRKGLIEDLPVEDGTVDWVISNCVINLSPDKARVFSEIARVLRPGGAMLVSDIVVEDLPEGLRSCQELYSACVAGAVSEGDYLDGLRAAGLQEVEVRARRVYSADDIAAFILSEELPMEGLLTEAGEAGVRALAQVLQGKVASIKVYARRPV